MENQQQSSGGGRKPWAAYNLIERGDRTIWSRVGSAFKNHDGSWNIFLDSVPLGGKIQIREVEDREKRSGVEKGALAASTEQIET
jgi:hypothetical protein